MTATGADVHGTCDARFAALRERFIESFAAHGELGAAVAVYVGGQCVVDLWGGIASRADARPWRRDTLVNVFSTTKGLAALCIHHLAERGALDLDAPVAHYWPEFADHDKGAITVRHALSHRAGLPALRAELPHAALYDQRIMASALAAQAPFWSPGSRHGYHAQTFGFLLAELVLRVTGDTLGRYLRERICGPLGADVHVGLAAEHDVRVAKLTRPLGEPPADEVDLVRIFQTEPQSLTARAFTNPTPSPGAVNTRAFRAAELPAANGHATAQGLARIYAQLARAGGALLSRESIAGCQVEHSHGLDEVLRLTTRFGPGFMLTQAGGPGWFCPNPNAFGHPGLGGSIAFADPTAEVSFAYVMNRAGMNVLVGERPRRLISALYDALI